jgi:hypothetical protein
LQQGVSERLTGDNKVVFDHLSLTSNLEGVLSRLRVIAAALGASTDRIEKLSGEQAEALDQEICGHVKDLVTQPASSVLSHKQLAMWATGSRFERPLEIFTTNYDLLIENGFELIAAPYFDGFVGAFDARFRSDLVDDDIAEPTLVPPKGWTRIWKLHGSVSWVVGDRPTDILRVASKPGKPLAIYPSLQKYEESRRVPFVAIADRLRRALALPETLVVTIGYSFGDQHLNEMIFNAAEAHARSETVALFYDSIPSEVDRRARELPNLTVLGASGAIIGGDFDTWDTSNAPPAFVDGTRARIGDFRVIAEFLAYRSGRELAGSGSTP